MAESVNDVSLDAVFADLMEGDEELRSLLHFLESQLPGALFQLTDEEGHRVPDQDIHPLTDAEQYDLHAAAEGTGELVGRRGADGEWYYALALSSPKALLLFSLPGHDRDLTANAFDLGLVRNCIDRALLRQEHQSLIIENEQILRQINVLNQQHSTLIEDNFRQYRVIQEKEKEYARTLESEIARQTAELRETNARLERASQLQSEFLANMSHELRTPMNAVIGFTELLAETDLGPEQANYTDTIRNAASDLLVLINDILDLAKIEAGRIELEEEAFGLPDLLDGVTALFRIPAKEKHISLTTRLDPQLPPLCLGDSNRLRQVLINLVGNAMKFTDQGGVEVRVEEERRSGARVWIRFAVEDSGIGIPPARQDAIFDKFTQVDGSTTRKYGGTGLGLAICRQLVGLMGGAIALASSENEGSTFSFTLPFKIAEQTGDTSDAGPEAAEKTGAGGAAAGLRVLLVEDNPVNQRLAKILIVRQGCDVEVANDGLEALEQLKTAVFDMVLMDIQMPHMDGLEATKRIRELEAAPEMRQIYASLKDRSEPLPVIGLTAYARKEDEAICYEAGMNGFLAKPIDRAKLAAILQG